LFTLRIEGPRPASTLAHHPPRSNERFAFFPTWYGRLCSGSSYAPKKARF